MTLPRHYRLVKTLESPDAAIATRPVGRGLKLSTRHPCRRDSPRESGSRRDRPDRGNFEFGIVWWAGQDSNLRSRYGARFTVWWY